MKRIFSSLIILVLLFSLVSCANIIENEKTKQEEIYLLAVESGYTGTYEEWLESIKGEPGATIEKVEFDEEGRLVIYLTNGTILDPVELPKEEEHVHDFCNWISVLEASCQNEGLEIRYCVTCNYSEARNIPNTEHTEGEWVIDKYPTFEENGLKTLYCEKCQEAIRQEVATFADVSYNYPMDEVTMLPGTITRYSNTYIIASGYHGAVIELKDLPYNTVKITKRTDATLMGYAFLKELPTVGNIPTYTSGYKEVYYDENNEAILDIPTSAKYLYIYHHSNDIMYLPDAVLFYQKEVKEEANTFTVGSWNIGHFSNGASTNSKITDANFNTSLDKYQDYIYDEINTDILILNEYSNLFTPSNLAKSTLFNQFNKVAFEGVQSRYSCNAVYSNLELVNIGSNIYNCNQTAEITHTTAIKASDYYYVSAELYINGEKIVIVGVHLGFDSNKTPDTVCLNQIEELISKYKDEEYVIMLGDWNVKEFSYFDKFVDAGYTLGNTDSTLYTYPGRSLDNIIVKGLSISNFRVHYTDLSDHYGVTAKITLSE